MRYATQDSAGGEAPPPDLGRREAIAAVGAGLLLVPAMRLGGSVGANWNPALVRPPGAVSEDEFLARCIKCGQCMRVCPTNVLQPAGLLDGAEALWTPMLNNRIGTSGCQLNCIACGQVCPTGAIRPFSLDEKLGRGTFAEAGPIRMGTAFLDRGRCLPWAMDRPCIVCEENCPVTPKAIRAIEEFATLHNGRYMIEAVEGDVLTLRGAPLRTGTLATGDYFLAWGRDVSERAPLVANTADSVTLGGTKAPSVEPGTDVAIQIRLQKPVVDPALCIGCGTCEHECPVSGRRAIRVTADNESRSRDHSLLLRNI